MDEPADRGAAAPNREPNLCSIGLNCVSESQPVVQIEPTAGSCGTEGSLKTASAPRASSQSARSVKVPPTSTPIARTAPPFESVECTLRPNHEGLCLRSLAVAPPLAAVLLSRPKRALRPGAGHAGLRRASRP